MVSIYHSKTSLIPDDANTDLVRPSDWNASHVIAPLSSASRLIGSSSTSTAVTEIQLGANLSMSGTTLNGPSLTGYVPYTGATSNVNLGAFNLICAEVLTDTVIAENLYFNSVPFDSLICTSVTSGQLTNVQMGSNLNFFEGELSVTNAALTRTNDTNVTLTLTGSAGSALLAAVNLALGWNGTLAATRGGTGTGSYIVGDILYADTTTSLAKLADVATGNVLLSGGVGVAPSWGKVSASSAITGVLPIANGGTNASSQTSNGICYYDGSKITTSAYATLSFIAGDIDLLITHPSVVGTVYEIAVTSSSCQYIMAYNIASTFQGICGTAATENYWTLSTKGLGLSVSASALWFGSTSNDDVSFYRNTTERLRLMTTGVYVPDVLYLSAASPTINAMVTGTTLIQSSVRLISAYAGAASANSHYFLGSGNDGGLLQLFGASGTIASPTALTTDGRMGGVFGRGYAATGYSNAVTAISFHAETTFTDTSTPTYIAFATTASGATTRTERARITASGNFGINVVPTAKLHVVKSLYETPSLTFGSDCATIIRGENAELACGFGYPSYAGMYLQARYSTNTSLPLFLNPVGGDVLIGTSTSSGKVTVNLGGSGTSLALLTGNASNYNAFVMGRASADATIGIASTAGHFSSSAVAGDCVIRNESSSKALILQAGTGSAVVYVTNSNVGVNTTPSYRFHINENQGYSSRNANPLPAQLVVQSGASGFLKIGNYYTGGVGTCSAIQSTDLFSGADHGVNLLLNPLGGNVGVHTGTPTKPFHVYANVADHCSIIENVNASGYGLILAAAIDPLRVGANGEYGGERFIVKADGKVGVNNSSPSALFDVAGFIRSSGTTGTPSTGSGVEILFNSGNGYVQAYDRGASAYRTLYVEGSGVVLNPNSGGNVGIGNTGATPRAKLEVVGDIWTDWNDRFIGTVYQTGAAYKMGFATTTAVRALDLIAMSADSSSIRFWTGSTPSVNAYIDHVSNVVLGNQSALATNATNGFVYIRTCAGTPTGAPTAFTGHVAIVYDTTNNKFYAYNGSWRSVTLT